MPKFIYGLRFLLLLFLWLELLMNSELEKDVEEGTKEELRKTTKTIVRMNVVCRKPNILQHSGNYIVTCIARQRLCKHIS
jgi:hypothetical protein